MEGEEFQEVFESVRLYYFHSNEFVSKTSKVLTDTLEFDTSYHHQDLLMPQRTRHTLLVSDEMPF